MTYSSHDRPDSASSKRATLNVVSEQHPLLYQFIENNQYLWTKTVKDFVEAALRDGNLPVVLDPSPRTRPKRSRLAAAEKQGRRNIALEPSRAQPKEVVQGTEEVAVGSDTRVAQAQPEDRSDVVAVVDTQQLQREVKHEPEVAAAASVAEASSSGEVKASEVPESLVVPESSPAIGSSSAGVVGESEKARLKAMLLSNLQQFGQMPE